MPVNRFYIDQDLQQSLELVIEGDEFHHLCNATRKRSGERVEIINGRGFLAEGVVKEIKKFSALIAIDEVIFQEKESKPLILIQGVPRMNRLDTIIEKCTELGVSGIHLFGGDRSERKELSDSAISRAEKVAIAAVKQCGRLYLPALHLFDSLEESLPKEGALFFGDIDPEAPLLFHEWIRQKSPESAAFAVGPEGGFSEREEEILKEKGAVGVKLADHILRTDTAPILAIGLLRHLALGRKT